VAWRRQRARAALACALLLAAGQPRPARAAEPSASPAPAEAEVKAAFLYHFAQLVTWPDEGPGAEARPMVPAIIGRDPFGDRLEATIGRQTVRGRPLHIERARTVEELAAAPDLLFVGTASLPEAERLLRELPARPILTVGAVKGFARRGGMVEFRVTADARVAFDINLQAVERAGLRMSSQLLKIARIVETEP
jgi:uncharacterized protein DUF4154